MIKLRSVFLSLALAASGLALADPAALPGRILRLGYAEGSVQYGMQSFDQSLFQWYQQGLISYESAVFYATNPSEFALKVSGVDSAASKAFGGRAGSAAGGIELS